MADVYPDPTSASFDRRPHVGGARAAVVASLCVFLLSLVIAAVFVVGMWKMFVKAGRPGWAAIVPIYNTYIILDMVGRPGWWLILLFIPLVNIVIWLLVCMDLAKAFGKDPIIFGLLLNFLLGIGLIILGFNSAQYQGPPN